MSKNSYFVSLKYIQYTLTMSSYLQLLGSSLDMMNIINIINRDKSTETHR